MVLSHEARLGRIHASQPDVDNTLRRQGGHSLLTAAPVEARRFEPTHQVCYRHSYNTVSQPVPPAVAATGRGTGGKEKQTNDEEAEHARVTRHNVSRRKRRRSDEGDGMQRGMKVTGKSRETPASEGAAGYHIVSRGYLPSSRGRRSARGPHVRALAGIENLPTGDRTAKVPQCVVSGPDSTI
eukprot:GHVU01008272.1.p2 GENE.GHVU01008272.1~~GHVU01008272.1.p2  ORF type:complete len:183 (+),score=18.29 GHVU01008272.1:1627-2175(+)